MSDDQRSEEIEQLEALMAGASRAFAFPALAEAQRRAGHPEVAERVARQGLERAPHTTAGRVALALALLDQKRTAEAGAELERLLGGETEHAIAHEAVANEAPEGLATADLAEESPAPALEPLSSTGFDTTPVMGLAGSAGPVVGELSTIDPYPDSPDSGQASQLGSDASVDAGPDDLVMHEPVDSGPFGPPPPPAPAEPLVFDADEVRDDELDTAFAEAESDTDQMLGADDVAQAALAAVPDEEDGDAELDPVAPAYMADGEDDFREAVTTSPASPFATETVAGLLEQQGHGGEADRLRGQMAQAPDDSQAFSEASDLERDRPIGGADPLDLAEEPLGDDAGSNAPSLEIDAPEAVADAPSAMASTDEPPTAGTPGTGKNQATLERWLDNLRRDKR